MLKRSDFCCFVFGALFCTGGAYSSTCPTGYTTLDTEKHIDTTYNTFSEATFMAPENGGCRAGGYSIMEIPDDVIPIYNGFEAGNPVTLCEDGYLPNNGTCVAYTQGSCQNNYEDLALNSASFVAETNGMCAFGGYTVIEVPDDIVPIYNGFVTGAEVTLCSNGYLSNNGSCVTYSAGDCPTDYVDLALNADTMTTLSNGVCPTNYSKYTINQQCDANTDDAVCAILCANGLNYTDIGTCAEFCPGPHHTLKTSTGLAIPIYATKQITPSINIQLGENVCYVNMVPGRASNAINVQYDNQIYHTVY